VLRSRKPASGDDDILELAHVGHDVAQTVAPLGQGDDRVPTSWPGPW
jgi:hypothetical protein